MKKKSGTIKQKFANIFKAVYQKEHKNADEILGGIRLERKDKFAEGYLVATRAMLKARESRDDRYFVARIGDTRLEYVRAKKLLQETRRTHLLSERDKGYIAAWLDYIDTIVESGLLPEKRVSEEAE